jgi:uncharacterized membrane protein
MAEEWEPWLVRWTQASLIDSEAAEQIRAYEASRTHEHRLRWPILVTLGLGALAFTAGVMLFVSAHWDDLSAGQRISVLLATLLGIHVAGAFYSRRFRSLAIALHAVGTAVLGAAIALVGQTYNLGEHWPAGILLWTIGGAIGWFVLGHWIQGALFAVLAPSWLALEWWYLVEERRASSSAPALVFLFLVSTAYLSGRHSEDESPLRRALVWIGAFTLLPLGIALSFSRFHEHVANLGLLTAAWTLTFLIPFGLAILLRASLTWMAAAMLWAAAVVHIAHGGIAGYAWDAVGAIGLAIGGMREGSSERVNLGIAGFALTVAIFYFSNVMDKLGRSASLLFLGLLFLGGGWALERLRRKMVERTRTVTP